MSETENNQASNEPETKKSTTSFVVVSHVKDFVRSKSLCVGGDLVDGLSAKIESLLETAVLRAEANGRKTIRSCDL